jgi:hypothetical protein
VSIQTQDTAMHASLRWQSSQVGGKYRTRSQGLKIVTV